MVMPGQGSPETIKRNICETCQRLANHAQLYEIRCLSNPNKFCGHYNKVILLRQISEQEAKLEKKFLSHYHSNYVMSCHDLSLKTKANMQLAEDRKWVKIKRLLKHGYIHSLQLGIVLRLVGDISSLLYGVFSDLM